MKLIGQAGQLWTEIPCKWEQAALQCMRTFNKLFWKVSSLSLHELGSSDGPWACNFWDSVRGRSSAGAHDGLDTTIMGPWMDNWDIVHHNRHVAAHLAAKVGGSEQ